MSYEIIANYPVSIAKDGDLIRNQFGDIVSVEQVESIYVPGHILADEDVAGHIKDSLDKLGDKSPYADKLAKSSKEPGAPEAPAPVDNYDALTTDEVIALLKRPESNTELVLAVQEYEKAHQARKEVLTFNIALNEAPHERTEGKFPEPGPEDGTPTGEVSEDGKEDTRSESQKVNDDLENNPVYKENGAPIKKAAPRGRPAAAKKAEPKEDK